jgi:hypothetical protein
LSGVFARHGALPNSRRVLGTTTPPGGSAGHDSPLRQKSRTNRKKSSTTDHQHWDP